MSFWEKVLRTDSRIIYAILVIGISISLVNPIGLPLSTVDTTKQVYNEIEKLQPGDRVLVSFDYSPGGAAELDPIANALLSHFLQKGLKVYAVSSEPAGVMYATKNLELYEEAGKVYGEDFVNLGYFVGGEPAIAAFGENIRSTIKVDVHDTPLDDIKMMKDVKGIGDMDMAMSINVGPSGGGTADVWVRQIAVVYKDVPFILGVTAVMTPNNLPYLQSGQIKGLLGGLRPAAEYEMLLEQPGQAVAMMDAQSVSHIIILTFIALGNIAYFVTKSKKGI